MDDRGEELPVYLAANPSHLETVDGVLEGIVRAKQDRKPIGTFSWLPILVHGDAAFAGQGVVVETLQMSQLRGYRTGGTIHVVVNNQVGFTTVPQDARTSVYATDVAKTIQAPIFHVNGDDPEAVVRVSQLAFAYRQRWHRDVVIDLVCYRRRGHNEGDDPSMTQPLMTNLIEAKRSVRRLYVEALVGRGDITEEEYEQAKRDFQNGLEIAFAETHAAETGTSPVVQDAPVEPAVGSPETTGVSREIVHMIGDAFVNKPDGFTVHAKLQQLLEKRLDMSRNGAIDWGFSELLAFGSLLVEGTPVRLAGQDSRRGTFVQRHSVLHDRVNGQEWIPLTNLSDKQGKFWVYDSLLSEYAALAFEYGYSVERADALVLWEAQFGDFVNGAQSVLDEFISSAEQKWGQLSSVVLLLPHGYEGQGPDHSSARIERYLQMCAQDNMTVARPSTPASYFHLLRRQAYARPRRPLVVFTPKAMLRLRGATSPVDDFLTGKFEPVLDDDRGLDRAAVKRVLLHAGKIHWDLKAELDKNPNPEIALVRLEQYYPAPIEELNAVLDSYPNAAAVLGAGRAREPGRMAVHRSRGRQAPPRPHDPPHLAGIRGLDGHGFAEGARARAGRDPQEGAHRLGRLAVVTNTGCRSIRSFGSLPQASLDSTGAPVAARASRPPRRSPAGAPGAASAPPERACRRTARPRRRPSTSRVSAGRAAGRQRSCRRRRSRPCCWCARG